jgi:hypothetical protein
MLYHPTLHLRGGRLARTGKFWTADDAFRGSLGDAVKFFGERAGLRAFHLVLDDGDPLGDDTRAAIADAREHGATTLLLEGAIADAVTCERLAALGVTPVATPALARDPRLTPTWRDEQPLPVYLATDAESDALADLLDAHLPAGLPPLLYRPPDPMSAVDVYHRLREALPAGAPFIVATPPVTPDHDSIAAQMAYVRRIYRFGVPAIAVDGEWFIDYHLT